MYAEILIAVSFAIASYQDVRSRAVSDIAWIPAVAGLAYVLLSFLEGATPGFEFFLLKLALIGGIALAFTFFGGIGQADAIAIVFVAGDPYALSPLAPLFGAAIVAMVHIGYEYGIGNARGTKTIPMAQFLKEQRWIPKAIVNDGDRQEVDRDVNISREEVEAANKPDASVEVSYGVPTVAYLGVGYIGFLVYLIVLNFQVFTSLP